MISLTFLVFQGFLMSVISSNQKVSSQFSASISQNSLFPIVSSSNKFNFFPNQIIFCDSKVNNKTAYFLSSTLSDQFFSSVYYDVLNDLNQGILLSIIDLQTLDYISSFIFNWKSIITQNNNFDVVNSFIFISAKIIYVIDKEITFFVSCFII